MGENGNKESSDANKGAKSKPSGAASADANDQSYPSKKYPEPPNWVEKGTFWVLAFTLAAVCYAGYEARRLADLTDALISDGQKASKQQAVDTQASLALTKQAAEAASKSANAAQVTADATLMAANESHRLAESAAQSNTTTQRLADAAIKANSVSIELLRTVQQSNEINRNVQRAFIFAKGVDLRKITSVWLTGDVTGTKPIGWQSLIQWENSGNTPAKDLTISNSCWWSFMAVKDQFAFDISTIDPNDKALTKTPDIHLLLGPKQSLAAGPCFFDPLFLYLHQLEWIQYYTFGTAKYRDILTPEYIHRTEYCYILKIKGDLESDFGAGKKNAPGTKPLTIEGYPCEKHNCADEECSQKGA